MSSTSSSVGSSIFQASCRIGGHVLEIAARQHIRAGDGRLHLVHQLPVFGERVERQGIRADDGRIEFLDGLVPTGRASGSAPAACARCDSRIGFRKELAVPQISWRRRAASWRR